MLAAAILARLLHHSHTLPHRPESVPRLFNLLEIQRDVKRLRVHTRGLRKQGGAWEGWAVWPGKEPHEKRTYYEVTLP